MPVVRTGCGEVFVRGVDAGSVLEVASDLIPPRIAASPRLG